MAAGGGGRPELASRVREAPRTPRVRGRASPCRRSGTLSKPKRSGAAAPALVEETSAGAEAYDAQEGAAEAAPPYYDFFDRADESKEQAAARFTARVRQDGFEATSAPDQVNVTTWEIAVVVFHEDFEAADIVALEDAAGSTGAFKRAPERLNADRRTYEETVAQGLTLDDDPRIGS